MNGVVLPWTAERQQSQSRQARQEIERARPAETPKIACRMLLGDERLVALWPFVCVWVEGPAMVAGIMNRSI
jgi:hypothetical protein